MTHLVVVGDAMLDRDVEGQVDRVAPDAPVPVLEERSVVTRPGGAGLAAVLARRDGLEVTLVTAIGHDAAGGTLRAELELADVEVVDLGLASPTPEKTRLRAAGASIARWDRDVRPAPDQIGALTSLARRRVGAADAVLVSCYGRNLAVRSDVRACLSAIAGRRPVTWDPHPRGPAPIAGCTIVTPNRAEAAVLVPEVEGAGLDAVTARAATLVERWGCTAVAVTLGADGALVSTGDGLPFLAPPPLRVSGDTCGAGDRFASAVARELAAGAVPTTATATAVSDAARYVADGGAATVHPSDSREPRPDRDHDPVELARSVRDRGGTVVATGGCFDLVHAGHVHLLEAARALGDCLVVCVNSDASVRRLKGPQRPVVPETDRVELLQALSCVDGVVLFDDDTPVATLRRLRPHVFAKGGDYGSTTIPEADVLASWGGQAVTLPYLRGRSTTRILEEVRGSGTR